MVYVKMELACLIICIFLALRYHAAMHINNTQHKTFTISMHMVNLNLLLNILSVMLVRNLDTVPVVITDTVCRLYTISLLATLYVLYLHVKFVVNKKRSERDTIGIVNQIIFAGIILIGFFMPIRYEQTELSYFPDGPLDIYGHACSMLLVFFTFSLIVMRWKELDIRIKGTITIAYIAVLFSLVVQRILDRSGVAALGITIAIIAFNITIENPDLLLLRQMELEKRRAEAERQRAEAANASKSKFVAVVSHEIRTPMNVVLGMAEMLIEKETDETKLRYLQNIKSSADSLVVIVNDILDRSKIEAGKMEIITKPYDIRDMLENVRMIVENRIHSKPLEILEDYDSRLPKILVGDCVRIRQILINLMNNAAKFTEKGHIKLTIEILSEEDDCYMLRFTVSDTGMGIKPEDMKKLFGAFSQVDQKKNHGKEGTGLGLTISSDLVRLMGGKLQVSSEYGKGTEFFFTIRQGKADSLSEEETETAALERLKGKRVLLVDDTELNLEIEKEILEMFGMSVETASSGTQALYILEHKRFDIIFTDYYMPEMNGTEFTAQLRKKSDKYFDAVPVIAITGDTSEETKQEFIISGITDYIEKPVEISKLKEIAMKYS